jgi:hypothetical protein
MPEPTTLVGVSVHARPLLAVVESVTLALSPLSAVTVTVELAN